MDKQYSYGFSLVEALVALTLFTVFFTGAITILSVFETESQAQERTRVVQDEGYAFLIEWANYARERDVFTTAGTRPTVSVLDDFSAGVDFVSISDYDFTSQETAQKIREVQTRLMSVSGINVSSWQLTVDADDSDVYRTLTLVINGNQQLQWFICC